MSICRPGTVRRPRRSPMLIYGRGLSRNENDKRYLNRVYARLPPRKRDQRRGWCLQNTQVLYGRDGSSRARARTFVRVAALFMNVLISHYCIASHQACNLSPPPTRSHPASCVSPEEPRVEKLGYAAF